MGLFCGPAHARTPVPVFPGAEGFGTETAAGRGGRILKVTTLRDHGTGSLRAAIESRGPRIVVFEISGNITLTKNLIIKNPSLTIAGQTAPSPGITLKGAGIRIKTHDVLIQHLRIRVGDEDGGPEPTERDGCTIHGPDGYNIVLDHLSVSWAIDKNTSTWYGGPRDITISNSIISEALNDSTNPQGAHSMGSLVGDHAKRIAFVGNLWAHNKNRNPAMKGDTSSVVLNNVMYNSGYWYMYFADDFKQGGSLASIVGNVFIPGPDTPVTAKALAILPSVKKGSKIFLRDNLYPGVFSTNEAKFDPMVSSPPVWDPSLIVRSSVAVMDRVLADAGARPADRDAVDRRIIGDVRKRTGRIIDSQRQVGGWPDLARNARAFDVPSDPNGDDDGDGYTNIEEVLQEMAAQVEGRADKGKCVSP